MHLFYLERAAAALCRPFPEALLPAVALLAQTRKANRTTEKKMCR